MLPMGIELPRRVVSIIRTVLRNQSSKGTIMVVGLEQYGHIWTSQKYAKIVRKQLKWIENKRIPSIV